MNRRSLYDNMVIADTYNLINLWRNKLSKLKEEKPELFSSQAKFQFIRNCPPEFVTTDNGLLQFCKLSSFCPWCYARRVGEVYDCFAELLPKRGKLSKPITLFELHFSFQMIQLEAGAYPLSHVAYTKRIFESDYRKLGLAGAYYNFIIEPYRFNNTINYRFKYRLLSIVEESWIIPTWITERRFTTSRLHKISCRKELINPIARTCRYPKGLLRSDASVSALALNFKDHIRMSAFKGCLYSRKKNER